MNTFQTEQGIRTLIDEQLKNLGWNLTGWKERNVWQEQPRTEEERRKLKRGRPDYVLYSKDQSIKQPLIIIEAKSPWKNLDDALRQGCEYAQTLDAPIVFATDGIYYKTLHTKKQKPLLLNWEEVDELFRELEAIKFLLDNEVNTISEEVIYDRKQLIRIFEDSNDLLRDEWFRAWIERFWEFSNILFLKLIGELEDLKEEEWRDEEVVLEKYLRWSQWKDKRGWELLDFVNNVVLQKIGQAYKDDKIFTPLQIKNPETLKKIIDKLDPLNLINIDSDIKGDSFEYFLKQSTATKNDLGEYFTPRHIVKVMVKLLNPQIGEKIYDPFCWTGWTLIETFKHISHNMARTKSNWDQLRKNTLFWNEITTTARITKMNMILVGDGHSGIQQENSLKNPIEDKYDIVITNMPYSQKTEYGAYYELPSNNGDSICIQHCIKAIDKASENGRMALVVPEGFLFRKDLQKTREYLLDRCTLKSIISLPQGVFLPYTGVKTNILYCTDVKKNKTQEKFWYFDVKSDGYSLDNHRRKLESRNDLQNLLEYRNPENQDPKEILKIGFSQINMEDIRENDLVLIWSRYVKPLNYQNVKWQLVKLKDIFVEIKNWLNVKQNSENGKYRVSRIESISKGVFDIERTKYTNDIVDENNFLLYGDILFSHINSYEHLAKSAIFLEKEIKVVHWANLIKFRPNTKKALPLYLSYVFKSEDFIQICKSFGQRAVNQASIRVSDLREIEIPLPPIEEQEELVKKLQKLYKEIEYKKKEVEVKENEINDELNFIWGK
jgi:type I restriction enzyme M protein